METRVVRPADASADDPAIAEACRLLRQGQLVAFPTETVYGLGADASNPAAVQRIYQAKERPSDNPLIVHIGQVEDLGRAARIVPDAARLLAERFWPGPLTLVLPARQGPLRQGACRGLDTVALRMPDHPVALALIRHGGLLLAAPSANRSGRPSPTRAQHVLDDLGGRIPLILDAGPCRVGLESAVVDLSGERPRLLRPGGIPREEIEEALGRALESPRQEDMARSPGLKHRHYQPSTPLYLIPPESSDETVVQWIANNNLKSAEVGYWGVRPRLRSELVAAPFRKSPAEAAHYLFFDLRDLDRLGLRVILADRPAGAGLEESLRDRLDRASTASVHSLRPPQT